MRQAAMKASASSGRTPAFCGSAPVLISTNRTGERPCLSISLASAAHRLGRSTEWMASNRSTASRALLDCSGPIRCNSRPGWLSRSGGHLAWASWTRFSPKLRWPAAITGMIAAAPKVLETATRVTPSGSRPASRQAETIASRTAARGATGSWRDAIMGARAEYKINRQIAQILAICPNRFSCLSATPAAGRGIAMRMQAGKPNHMAASRRRVSVRTRIMLLALLLIVPPMIDRVRLLENTRTERFARALEEVADLAQRGTEAQSEIINSTRALLQLVARAYAALTASGQSCAALLSGFATDVPWIKSLSVVGPDDRISCSTRPSSVGVDLSDRDYIRQARRSSDFMLSEYLIERVATQPAMVAAYPVSGKDGGVDAIIVAPIELQWVERFAGLIDQRNGATAFLLDPHGTVLAKLPGRGKLDDQGAPDHPLIRAAMAAQKGTLAALGLDGVRRIYAFSELPATDTRIVVGLDESEALGRIDRDISITYFQLAMFGLFGMLLPWFCGDRFILEPIRALARTAASIGRGDLEPRPTRDRWTMEFAPLATAL